MKTESLSVDLLRIDADTQSRISINEEVVEDYSELITESNGEWPFGPMDVFHDGNDYLVADGFHRTLAAQRANRSSVPCQIHKGTSKDARIFSMTANDRHGLRMSRADKRACVQWLLENGGRMSQKEVAEKAGVTTRTVRTIIAEQNPVELPPPNLGRKTSAFQGQNASQQESGAITASHSTQNTSSQDDATDYGKCPNCAGTKWDEDEFGVTCAKCRHPHGEPAGGADADRITTQRQKTIKTLEAAMRAFDDLHLLLPKPAHDEAIAYCKSLLKTARAWK